MSNKNTERIRALDDLMANKNPFLPNNPIFKNYINYFDEVFNKGGIQPDLNHYVPQDKKAEFEYWFCKSSLDLTRKSRKHKAVLLKGKVGRGKTTFTRYCIERKIPEIYKDVLIFYLDSESFRDDAEKQFEENLIDTIKLELEQSVFKNSFEFQIAFIKSLGFSHNSQIETNELFLKNLTLSNLLRFVDKLELKDGDKTGGILIVIDNIDENSKNVLEEGDSFAKELKKIAGDVCENKALTLFVTVREYNVKYFDTNSYFPIELPKADTEQIVKEKIQELSEKIDSESKEYSQVIDYGFNHSETSPQRKVITINGILTVHFLKSVVEFLHNSKDNEVLRLIEETSAGNLKVVVSNIFNMLQSVKLPHTELFAKTFIPDDAELPENLKDPLKFDVILQCLLAIQYPFFSEVESRLFNLFNSRNSASNNDCHCVLIIPRILYLLLNTKSKTYNEINGFFLQYGYEETYTEEAIKKCFAYGLFKTSYGTMLNHIEKNSSKIQLSSAGRYYVEKLIIEISYLQYVCEDTYVYEENYIPIIHKYSSAESKHTKNKSLDSAKELIMFIKKCEELELTNIKALGFNAQSYLDQASYISSTKKEGIKLSEMLTEKSVPIINILKN